MDELQKQAAVIHWMTGAKVNIVRHQSKIIVELVNYERFKAVWFCSKTVTGAITKLNDYIASHVTH